MAIDENWKIRVLLERGGHIISSEDQTINWRKEIEDDGFVQDFNAFLSFNTTLFRDQTGSFQVRYLL